jgi:hypothetical protein
VIASASHDTSGVILISVFCETIDRGCWQIAPLSDGIPALLLVNGSFENSVTKMNNFNDSNVLLKLVSSFLKMRYSAEVGCRRQLLHQWCLDY